MLIPVAYNHLLLILASDKRQVTSLHLILEELVDCKGDGLTRSNTHNSRCDTLVQSIESLFPK